VLRRYWFSFVRTDRISSLGLGCGVTALSRLDAERLIKEMVFPLLGEGEILAVVEDIDLNSLEENHVLPNIGNPSEPGVWFPNLQA
jgi:hypothetical protein